MSQSTVKCRCRSKPIGDSIRLPSLLNRIDCLEGKHTYNVHLTLDIDGVRQLDSSRQDFAASMRLDLHGTPTLNCRPALHLVQGKYLDTLECTVDQPFTMHLRFLVRKCCCCHGCLCSPSDLGPGRKQAMGAKPCRHLNNINCLFLQTKREDEPILEGSPVRDSDIHNAVESTTPWSH